MPVQNHASYVSDFSSGNEQDRIISDFLKKWNIPGASIAIANSGNIIFSKGYGYADRENEETVTSDHLFRIASISKMITAAAILKLEQDGKIKLEDTVFGSMSLLNHYDLSNIRDKRILEITVKQLLQHTAGWDREISGDAMFYQNIKNIQNRNNPPTAEDIITYMLGQRLDFSPGTKYAYSNLGYAILGRIIEKLSGESYSDFVKKNILFPCGINAMEIGSDFIETRLKGEVKYYTGGLSSSCYPDKRMVNPAYGSFCMSTMDAHGGWVASARELISFMESLNEKSRINHVLNSQTLKKMREGSDVCNKYGLGCQIGSNGNIWHTGSLPGTSALAAQISNGASWVILLNGRPDHKEYFSDLDKMMWKVYRSLQHS